MKNLQLENEVFQMLEKLIDDVAIEVVPMPRGDYQAVIEAAAMQIVRKVQEAK